MLKFREGLLNFLTKQALKVLNEIKLSHHFSSNKLQNLKRMIINNNQITIKIK